MIGRPVKSVTLLGEAVEISLCTLGKSFMYGNCMCSGCKGSSRLCLLWVIRLAKRVFMLSMSMRINEMIENQSAEWGDAQDHDTHRTPASESR
jgi:hypothetical protein